MKMAATAVVSRVYSVPATDTMIMRVVDVQSASWLEASTNAEPGHQHGPDYREASVMAFCNCASRPLRSSAREGGLPSALRQWIEANLMSWADNRPAHEPHHGARGLKATIYFLEKGLRSRSWRMNRQRSAEQSRLQPGPVKRSAHDVMGGHWGQASHVRLPAYTSRRRINDAASSIEPSGCWSFSACDASA
jgi:hypothetical protein